MTRNYVNDIMSIKELRGCRKPLLFVKNTICGAVSACTKRNLEMTDAVHENSQIVNYIYFLTNAGIDSSPAPAGALLFGAAQNARKQRGGEHADRYRQKLHVGISEKHQPRQKADGDAADRNRK